MHTKWLIIVDLDDTLIDTQAIEYLRKKRIWREVYRNFHRTFLSNDIRNVFSYLANHPMISMIIVTSSPKIYAEKLLSYYRFLQNVPIIGYHDTKKHKPETEPYERALSMVNKREKVLVIGDREEDIIPAKKLGLLSALALWYRKNSISFEYEPDYYLPHPSKILNIIKIEKKK